jgi:hypothetical protein
LSLGNYVLERLGLSFELPELPVMERLAFTVVSWLQRFKAPCASTASSRLPVQSALLFSVFESSIVISFFPRSWWLLVPEAVMPRSSQRGQRSCLFAIKRIVGVSTMVTAVKSVAIIGIEGKSQSEALWKIGVR